MKYLIALIVSASSFLANAEDLSLKNGSVLRDAQVRGVSGRNVVIVKHAGGLGMYAYPLFSPDSAAVISNLFPAVAVLSPHVEPVASSLADQQENVASAEKKLETAVVSNIRSAEMSLNNRYYQTALKRVETAIQHERESLERRLSMADDMKEVKKEISRLEASTNNKEESLKRHNIYRANTRTFTRAFGRRPEHDSLTWDQEQTLRYQDSRDARTQLDAAKARLKGMQEAQQPERQQFEHSAAKRLKAIEEIYADHTRRLQAGEPIEPSLMEARFLIVK